MISSDPTLWVVGSASTGQEALDRIPDLNPDVVTLDVQMPGMDGMHTLKRIMVDCPRPVIIVTATSGADTQATLHALQAGAFDYVPKQLSASSLDILHIREDLIAKIKIAAQSRHSPHSGALPAPSMRKPPESANPPRRETTQAKNNKESKEAIETCGAHLLIVALGISTGGPKALQDILPLLPRDLTVPIIIVQHMPIGFTRPFAERLNSLCAISVCEAQHGHLTEPGVAYIAPAGLHLTVDRAGSHASICLSENPRNQPHTPSVDVMMNSVAASFRSHAMGIIMTGMGADGARGMRSIHEAGGLTLGQNEATCAVYGMPRVCAATGVLDRVLPLNQIPNALLQATDHLNRSLS
jgi:two-component system, chemotaxis family, protein-glutamate methylesterase/glutaminase